MLLLLPMLFTKIYLSGTNLYPCTLAASRSVPYMMSMLKTKNEALSPQLVSRCNRIPPFLSLIPMNLCFVFMPCFVLLYFFCFLYRHTMGYLFSVCSRPCMMRPMAVSHFAHQYVGTNKIPSFDTSTSTVESITLSLPACITPNPKLRYCTVHVPYRLTRGCSGGRREAPGTENKTGKRPDVKHRKKKETKQLKPRSSSVE
jgi:hypothetical protein